MRSFAATTREKVTISVLAVLIILAVNGMLHNITW